jgi:hypothetical protein
VGHSCAGSKRKVGDEARSRSRSMKLFGSKGVSRGFQDIGNAARSFHHDETFAISLLLISCKDSIFADVSLYLMCMKHP